MGWFNSFEAHQHSHDQVTPITQESPVTFGHVKIQIYIDIYDTRISYPTLIILFALADVKACF